MTQSVLWDWSVQIVDIGKEPTLKRDHFRIVWRCGSGFLQFASFQCWCWQRPVYVSVASLEHSHGRQTRFVTRARAADWHAQTPEISVVTQAPAVSGCVMRFTQKIPNGKKWMEMVQAALEKVETITKRNESTKLWGPDLSEVGQSWTEKMVKDKGEKRREKKRQWRNSTLTSLFITS